MTSPRDRSVGRSAISSASARVRSVVARYSSIRSAALRRPDSIERAGGAEDRVALAVLANGGRRAVARLHVGACVAEVAHRAEVEQRGAARPADVGGERTGDLVARLGVGAVDRSYRNAGRREKVASIQPLGVGTLMPRPLSSHTNSRGTASPACAE